MFPSGSIKTCSEAVAADRDGLAKDCVTPAGTVTYTFADMPCPRAGAVAGCHYPASMSLVANTLWHYTIDAGGDGNSPADVETMCAGRSGTTFVTP
jgi:hypothetical protein